MAKRTTLSLLRTGLGRNAILGFLIVMTLLLLWKLLGVLGVTPVILMAGGWVDRVGLPPVLGQLVAFALAVLGAGALGWCIRTFVGSRRERFPILSRVLATEEQFQDFLGGSGSTHQQRVVVVDWPNEEVRSLGIITSQRVDESTGRELALVYLPNSPNPASGSLKLIDTKKLTFTDMSIPEACTLCFSRGSSAPGDVKFSVRTIDADAAE